MEYYIQVTSTRRDEPYPLTERGKTKVFSSGKDAADCVRYLKQAFPNGYKFRVLPMRSNADESNGNEAWRQREQLRFDDGTYQRLPWASQDWFIFSDPGRNHFAHVSTADHSKVAFTESPERGASDIQNRMKPGRYLQRFFEGVLTRQQISYWTAQYIRQHDTADVKFAWTPDEIEDVYTNGPDSCMSHKAGCGDFVVDVHPTRAYGAGDLAIVYIQDEDDITARVLVWPEKKIYGRCYGDVDRLLPGLHQAGYQDASGDRSGRDQWEGARLLALRWRDGDSFVVPFCDVATHADLDRNDSRYLRIARGGSICLRQTTGTNADVTRCGNCGEVVTEDETNSVAGEERDWCDRCVESHATECDCCNDIVARVNTRVTRDSETVCVACLNNNYVVCDACAELAPTAEVEVHNGDFFCADCLPFEDDTAEPSPTIHDPNQAEIPL